ncbi:MAG: segregation/condensation protein A [Thermodesulfovibrionales bacterium]
MQDSYSIRIPVFEGPLDLLLHLIRENKVDIYDIPIALITRQYLEYIELMKELNLEIAGEFLVMAATLIHIKSRMLLPVEETVGTEEEMDPRFELVQRLLEYQAFKEAALGLREREEEWDAVYSRKPRPEEEAVEEEPSELSLFDVNIFDLITAFKKILDRAPAETIAVTREALTVKSRMSQILEIIAGRDAMRFEELFETSSRSLMVVTFIALLEILKLGLARVYQEREFGAIWVIRPEERPAA